MICWKCREWAAKGCAYCQRCKRPAENVMKWDRFLQNLKPLALIVAAVITYYILSVGI